MSGRSENLFFFFFFLPKACHLLLFMYIIYIYNSHQLENYNNYNLEIYGITPNVLMASYLLKEKLNERGLSTIVEDTNLTEFLIMVLV